MNYINRQPFENILRAWENRAPLGNTGFAVDIAEEDDGYQIHADLPGVSKEKVEINVQDNVLSLNVDFSQKREDGKALHSERPSGCIQRAFRLSRNIDAKNIAANMKNGVLTLRLPKSEEAGKRQIAIQ
ncbi:MAG: Hsp20/alpha crystallin family protein [Candidatus Zeuxoniibacter abyssi]|nr:MAG: Hsp20/alpha crystallin family protein [Candidatus Persebacteraceae bacterium AB1(2)]